jgi:hypothetical protein
MGSDIIKIQVADYRKWNNMSDSDYAFENTCDFDRECGLSYLCNKDNNGDGLFKFAIVDEQKFFLAKIKYGI